jgi:hypothetical protein
MEIKRERRERREREGKKAAGKFLNQEILRQAQDK